MRRTAALFAMLSLAACGGQWPQDKEKESSTVVPASQRWVMPKETQVMGGVLSVKGKPIAGVEVRSGDVKAQTEGNGRFVLKVPAAEEAAITFSKAGLIPTHRRTPVLEGTPTTLWVVMMAEAPAIPLDASAGGTATGADGAEVVVPAGALVDGDGNPVTGMVNVHLTAFDPTVGAHLDAFPGELVGRDGEDVTPLGSLSVMDVTMRQNDEVLQVAPGQTLQVAFPVPSGEGELPATSPLWSMDEGIGQWVREGTATLDAEAGVYRGEIPHMSAWNVDIPLYDRACISGRIVDGSGNLVPGARLWASSAVAPSWISVFVTEDGHFRMLVARAAQFEIEVTHPGGGILLRWESSDDAPPLPSGTLTLDETSECKDLGDLAVPSGFYTGLDGVTMDCDTAPNPLAGTCAEDVLGIFDCFAPSGGCSIDESNTIHWGNGAQLQLALEAAPVSFGVSGVYLGAGGETCGTLDVPNALSLQGYTLEDAGGQSWRISWPDDTVTCDSGETVPVDMDAWKVFHACTAVGGPCNVQVTISP